MKQVNVLHRFLPGRTLALLDFLVRQHRTAMQFAPEFVVQQLSARHMLQDSLRLRSNTTGGTYVRACVHCTCVCACVRVCAVVRCCGVVEIFDCVGWSGTELMLVLSVLLLLLLLSLIHI